MDTLIEAPASSLTLSISILLTATKSPVAVLRAWNTVPNPPRPISCPICCSTTNTICHTHQQHACKKNDGPVSVKVANLFFFADQIRHPFSQSTPPHINHGVISIFGHVYTSVTLIGRTRDIQDRVRPCHSPEHVPGLHFHSLQYFPACYLKTVIGTAYNFSYQTPGSTIFIWALKP